MKNMLQENFNKIIENCNDYVRNTSRFNNKSTINFSMEFINKHHDIISSIEKIIYQLAIDPKMRKNFNESDEQDLTYDSTIDTEIIEDDNNSDDDLDRMTAEDVFKEELEAWGISTSSLAYEVFIYIAKYAKPDMEYDDILNTIANVTGKRKCSISSAISNVAKHADFSKSKYIPILTKLPRVKITKEYLIKQLIEFCE